jgi:hypothetical protein
VCQQASDKNYIEATGVNVMLTVFGGFGQIWQKKLAVFKSNDIIKFLYEKQPYETQKC